MSTRLLCAVLALPGILAAGGCRNLPPTARVHPVQHRAALHAASDEPAPSLVPSILPAEAVTPRRAPAATTPLDLIPVPRPSPFLQNAPAGEGGDAQDVDPPHFEPYFSRWYAPGYPYDDVAIPSYEIHETPNAPWDPYHQNPYKGDFPLFGSDDIFLNVTLTNSFLAEARNVPTPTGNTGPGPIDPDFWGDGQQTFLRNDLIVSFDLFKGQQAFKPVDWRLKVTPVFNYTDLNVEETGVVKVDPSEGTSRQESHVALQEAFAEFHLADLSSRYDFVSSEIGILPFRSDFRGFIFDDSNLGARLLGNYDNNKLQYNLAYFNMLDKDTNSQLNKLEERDQNVLIANVYRQDWPVDGYTTSFSFHYNEEDGRQHFDDNGFLVRPAPAGIAQENDVESFYLGWAGEGHLDRINITHAFYQALGSEGLNPIAGRDVDIDAQMAALELSYDIDWWRVRLFGLYASGDSDARDNDAEGFDSIVDSPNFGGGRLSFFNSQALPLPGVNLTNPFSFFPDLATSNTEGLSNFVNPGLNLAGLAVDFELTPKLRSQIGVNYLRFDDANSLEVFLELPEVENEIGVEYFVGTQYRPLLTNNIIVNAGASALLPGAGLERIYQSDETLYSLFVNLILSY